MNSKPSTGTDHRRRLLLLVAGTVLLCAVVLKKRVVPTWSLWHDLQQLEADQRAGIDVVAETARLSARLNELTVQAGGDRPAEERWRAVLSRIGSAADEGGPQLVSLAGEHLEPMGDRTLHTLPVVLTGRTDELLAFADALERDANGVHLSSLDLHLQRSITGHPPKLLATLYLRTIAP